MIERFSSSILPDVNDHTIGIPQLIDCPNELIPGSRLGMCRDIDVADVCPLDFPIGNGPRVEIPGLLVVRLGDSGDFQ
jgi:hypothetical protein